MQETYTLTGKGDALRKNRLELIAPCLVKRKNWILADLGSGKGFWTQKLAPFFKQVISIEPNEINFLELTKEVTAKNVIFQKAHMPDCLYKLEVDAVIMCESLSFTLDYRICVDALFANSNLKLIIITDGPARPSGLMSIDKDETLNVPYIKGNFYLNYAGYEWDIYDELTNKGWKVDIYDALSKIKLEQKIRSFRWFLVAVR